MNKKLSLHIFLILMFSNAGIAQELIRIPVHVHILEIDEKGYKTKAKPEKIELHFKKANKVWAQLNIVWVVKKIDKIPADTKVFKKNIDWLKKNVGIKNKAVNTRRYRFYSGLLQTQLHQKQGVINAYYLPYLFSNNCGISYSDRLPDLSEQFLMMADKMNPKLEFICPSEKHWHVLAHELGHQLHLRHEKRSGFLMALGSKKGKKISKEDQIKVMEFYKNDLKEYLEQ